MKSARYYVLLISIISSFIAPLSAVDVEWCWNQGPDSGLSFRYQLNGTSDDGWTDVEKGASSVVTEGLPSGEDTVFYLQSSYDGLTWSEPASIVRTAAQNAEEDRAGSLLSSVVLRATVSPYTLSIVDFYNGHGIEDARYLTLSSYGLSADAEVSLVLKERFAYTFSASYSLTTRKDALVPGTGTLHTVRLLAGNDILIPAGGAGLGLGAFGGVEFAFNSLAWSALPAAGMRLFIEWPLECGISLGASSRFSLTYHGAEDPLMKNISWLIEPITVTAAWRF